MVEMYDIASGKILFDVPELSEEGKLILVLSGVFHLVESITDVESMLSTELSNVVVVGDTTTCTFPPDDVLDFIRTGRVELGARSDGQSLSFPNEKHELVEALRLICALEGRALQGVWKAERGEDENGIVVIRPV